MTEKTEELIAEARRRANGHPNRRSGELMRDLADALAALTTPQEHGWSTQNRRDAESEAESRWPIRGAETFATERDQIIFQQGCINGFILGAEWWNARTPRGSESLCYGADGATDPKCPACAGHGYGGTDYMNSGHCRACGGSGDAPQGGDARERIVQTALAHVPVLGVTGRVVGCRCMDRVFVQHRETWAEHVADAILAAFPVLSRAAAPEEVEWEYQCNRGGLYGMNVPVDDPEQHRFVCNEPRLERRRKAGPWEAVPHDNSDPR